METKERFDVKKYPHAMAFLRNKGMSQRSQVLATITVDLFERMLYANDLEYLRSLKYFNLALSIYSTVKGSVIVDNKKETFIITDKQLYVLVNFIVDNIQLVGGRVR